MSAVGEEQQTSQESLYRYKRISQWDCDDVSTWMDGKPFFSVMNICVKLFNEVYNYVLISCIAKGQMQTVVSKGSCFFHNFTLTLYSVAANLSICIYIYIIYIYNIYTRIHIYTIMYNII